MERINTQSYYDSFKQHLTSNDRCIFSGRFGDGKSYFLREFAEQHKDDFIFITIYPINYQVEENANIFEYIKRDILLQLIVQNKTFLNDKEFSDWLGQSYIANNWTSIFVDLISVLPVLNIGVDLSKFIEKVRKHADKFAKKKKELTSESGIVENFIKSFDKGKGHIYEFDAITQLICDLNNRLRENNTGKEIVLIIEDLDRIDPAHIFRILNIFSAHFDRQNQNVETEKTIKNKFGFDRIVTVCDYDNIKNIYHHLYGKEADFYGYIGKFSTALPYRYTLRDRFREWILQNLDERLKKYNGICGLLADAIWNEISKKECEFENNLRYLKESITNGQKNILSQSKITLNVNAGREIIYLNVDEHPFLIFLDLLRHFNIDINIFLQSISNDNIKQSMVHLIGVCWLILDEKPDNEIQFFYYVQDSDDDIFDININFLEMNLQETMRVRVDVKSRELNNEFLSCCFSSASMNVLLENGNINYLHNQLKGTMINYK